MKDIVERLYSQGHNDLMAEAAEEIERLRQAIKYEDNRFGHIGTHGPDCYTWGPKHYECALAEIERLKTELAAETQRRWDGNRIASNEAAEELAASQAREAKLREALEGLVSWVYASAHWGCTSLKVIYAQAVLALPTDDTALREAIKVEYGRGYDDGFLVGAEKGRNISEELKQAKREAYKDAHDTCAKFGTVQSCLGYLCHQADKL